ncbi:hypothetical protein ACN469_20190 [Corallococcus terminator]
MKKSPFLLAMCVTSLALLSACGPEDELSQGMANETSSTPVEPEGDSIGASQSELHVSGDTFALATHGKDGGNPHVLRCPPSYVAVGLSGRAGGTLDQLALVCAYMGSDGNLGAQYVTTGAVGGGGGEAFSLMCLANQAVVGFRGRADRYVDRVGLYCSTIASWRASTAVQYFSPEVGGSGGYSYSEIAPQAYVVTSLNVRAGGVVDQFQGIASYISP